MRLMPPGLQQSIDRGWPTAWIADIDWPVETDPPAGKFWDGLGTLKFNGTQYQGVRHMGRILGIGGSKLIKTREVTLELRGVGESVEEFLGPAIRNRIASIWFAGMDRTGRRVNGGIDDGADLAAEGRCDRREVFADEQHRTGIRLILGEPAFLPERAQNLRYTPEWIKAAAGSHITGLDLLSTIENERKPWTKV
jgi:hypothetical protein